ATAASAGSLSMAPLLQVAPGADGGLDSFTVLSEASVRYFDGSVHLEATDLEAEGFGMPWGHSRNWTSVSGLVPSPLNGTGNINSQLPYLLPDDTTGAIAAVFSSANQRFFDLVSGTYYPRFFYQEQLTYNSTAGQFVLTDTTGGQLVFYDFSGSLPTL